jgi:hypothetical protein
MVGCFVNLRSNLLGITSKDKLCNSSSNQPKSDLFGWLGQLYQCLELKLWNSKLISFSDDTTNHFALFITQKIFKQNNFIMKSGWINPIF